MMNSTVRRLPPLLFWLYWLTMIMLSNKSACLVSAQRFMRQGFSNQEDFGAEMKLEDSEGAVDMTREMFLMQDLHWQLPPPTGLDAVPDRAVRRHVRKHWQNQHPLLQRFQQQQSQQPVVLKLLKKRGKYGLRAVGQTANGRKLRAFWRQSTPPPRGSVDFLVASYDEACRSRLFTVEFEVQLPPINVATKRRSSRGGETTPPVLPSIVYQVSVEPGSMNPKALVPRTASRVFCYPTGRGAGAKKIEIGTANVSVAPMKPGLIDPSWAKGRPIFRKGRNSGLM